MIRHSNGATRNAFKPQQTCIWQASAGPLFIKSVWMDRQGYRHFILNTDWTNHEDDQYQNLSKIHRRKQLEPLRRPKFADSKTALQSTESCSLEKLRSSKPQPLSEATRLNKNLCKQLLNTNTKDRVSDGFLKGQFKAAEKELCVETLNVDKSQSTELYIDPEENYKLTERVLQWLDLAGKATLSEEVCELPLSKSHKKRVFTANPSLGSGGSILPPTTTRRTPLVPLKRTESIHHLSLTLNEDDLVNHSAAVTKQSNIFHLSLLSGRKLRQMSSSRTKISQSAQNPQMSVGKMNAMSPKSTASGSSSAPGSTGTNQVNASKIPPPPPPPTKGKKKSLGKLGKTESIENQYRSMIHRQLLETSCNTQLAKRQLHIFMPNPKLGTATPSQSQNDCDSCLNSLISEVSKP